MRDQALAELVADRAIERVDGTALELRDLPDLLAGQTLFASERMIVIRNLSENLTLWNELEKYIEKISAETTIILLEAKPDKRTKTYKLLQQHATVREFSGLRNAAEATKFALDESAKRDLKLDRRLAAGLVDRVGISSWDIVHALEKLAVLETAVDAAVIERIIEAQPSEQVFGLFEASLRGQTARVHEMCQTLALSEEPYRVMGLLAAQVVQLAALVAAGSNANVAGDLGLKSDYGLSKLRPFAKTMTRDTLHDVVDALATADDQMKSTGAEPWSLVEQALVKISQRVK